MTLDELEQVLASVTDDDVALFGEPGATEEALREAEASKRCRFHPQHRELLRRHGLLGLQVREGIYSSPIHHQVISGFDVEPVLVVPGPNHISQFEELLIMLQYNNLEVDQMPVLFGGSGWLYHSDSKGEIREICDHRPTFEPCEQDLFALIAHHAREFRKHVDLKLRSE